MASFCLCGPELYNTVLGVHSHLEHTDVTIMCDNDALYYIFCQNLISRHSPTRTCTGSWYSALPGYHSLNVMRMQETAKVQWYGLRKPLGYYIEIYH